MIRADGEDDGRRYEINVKDLLLNRGRDLNLDIQPGDVISVAVDQRVYIYVDGAVRTPGRLVEYASRPITLMQALATSGGVTDRADLKGIQILRQSANGTQTVIPVNLKRIRNGNDQDPFLQDRDVVVVPETFF